MAHGARRGGARPCYVGGEHAIARGDIETVRDHLATLEGDTRELYTRLGLAALELSRRMGLDAELAAAIEAELRGA